MGGNDTLHGGDGDLDLLVGGSWNDKIFADDSLSTNVDSSDVVFGDQAELFFYGDESHKLQNATATDAGCFGGGTDIITLGPGDDLVSFYSSRPNVMKKSMAYHHFFLARHLEVTLTITSKEMMGRTLL